MKFSQIPKLIGSILNIKASSSVDVSADLENEPISPKSISQLIQDDEEKNKNQSSKNNI
jgi:hypothetical protein